MMRWQRLILTLAGLSGCAGVMLAALDAHLPDTHFITGGRAMLARGVEMLMWHAIALLGIALSGWNDLRWAAYLMALGMVLFVAPVVILALNGPALGFIAPWGGTLTMLSWLLLAVLAWRSQRRKRDHA